MHTPAVTDNGCIHVDATNISIGCAHRGAQITVLRTGDHITVFINGRFHHERDLDRTRRYQPQQPPRPSLTP